MPFTRSSRRQALSTHRSAVVAVVVGLLMVACGSSSGTATVPTPSPTPSPLPTPSPVNTKNMKISVDSTFTKSVTVGNLTTFDLDIQDVGTDDIPNLSLVFNVGDRFLDTYTVQSAGACSVDTNLPGLACGMVTHGSHLTFTIKATPKTAGSYIFKFTLNQYKTVLNQADDNEYEYSWTQTVTN
jgi:hypothetical protein